MILNYVQPANLSGLKFCIDPGHGGDATGAVGPTGLMEKDINLEQAFRLYDYLTDQEADTVIMTRTNDINLSLSEREIIANNHNVDYFISLHHNASVSPNTNYSLCLYAEYEAGNPRWPGIADVLSDIMSSYHAETKQIPDMGGQGDMSFLGFQLGVLNDLLMPGVLSEPSFISHPDEEKRFKNSYYLKTEAQATLYSYLIFLDQSLPPLGTVIGIAKNPEGLPLHLTTVYIEGNTDTSITDDIGNGYYRIENILPGSYELVAKNEQDTASVAVTVWNGEILFTAIILEGLTSPFVPTFNQPVLYSTQYNPYENGIELNWSGQIDDYVGGYRLFRADSLSDTFHLIADESILSKGTVTWIDTTSKPNQYYRYYYNMVDTSGLYESNISDIYPVYFNENTTQLLIVDGFDRLASWTQPYHTFATYYGKPSFVNGVSFDCVDNNAIENGMISLQDYNAVFWFLGDEGIVNETFSFLEQEKVKAYLESGKNLFVTGSEVGWDLAREGANPDDKMFYENYLKAEYLGDNAGNLSVHGTVSGIFKNLSFIIGQIYPEDYPDYIMPYGGSTINLKYGNNLNAGIQYEGTFGSSTESGKLVYMAFPMETISDGTIRSDLITAILNFFDFPMLVYDSSPWKQRTMANTFILNSIYPNPTNNSIVIPYQVISSQDKFHLVIYNLLGQIIYQKNLGNHPRGQYRFQWRLEDKYNLPISSGMYWIMLTDGQSKYIQKITVIR